MNAPALYEQLKLFGALINKKSVAAQYRVLALAPDHVRGIGLFGQMRCETAVGLDAEITVDGSDFLQVLRSLPNADFIARHVDGALRWTCGSAKGHLTVLGEFSSTGALPTPSWTGSAPEHLVGEAFADGLALGALASGREALRAAGLMGIQITTRDGQSTAYATDDIGLSCCGLGVALDEPAITLSAEAVALLAAFVRHDGDALLTHDARAVYCVSPSAELVLNQIPSLRKDLATEFDKYRATTMAVPLWHEAVTAFLRRAEALSDEKAIVEVVAEDGKMGLIFREATSSSEEYFIVRGGPQVSLPPIRVEAWRLAKVLGHADRIVFDYAANNLLVLTGPHGFSFVLSGPAAT